MARLSTARPLTVKDIENLKPETKRYKRPVGKPSALCVGVQPSGHKVFWLRHAKVGKLTLGSFPDISLKTARDRADKALREIRQGRDPSVAKEKRRRTLPTRSRWSLRAAAAPRAAAGQERRRG